LLRLEGLAAFAAGVALFAWLDHSWVLFLALFLAPDVSFLAYLAGPRTGCAIYNIVHTYALPIATGLLGVLAGSSLTVAVSLIWLAHIGADRALGYGLKYPTAFQDTHLGRLGVLRRNSQGL
jgi:hypothetical protein